MGPVGMGPEEAAALTLMPVSRMALERMAPARASDLVKLELYTDGSGGNGARRPGVRRSRRQAAEGPASPAWAVVAVGILADGARCLLGFGAAPMPGFASHGGRLADGREGGPELRAYEMLGSHVGTTSFAAELFAALWALLWARQLQWSLGRAGPGDRRKWHT